MKGLKITYYISNYFVVLAMLASGLSYFFAPIMKEGIAHVGFPDWFRVELGTAKILGILALGIPVIPARIKEWAYAGFFINLFSAFLAHYETGDPVFWQVRPLIVLFFLIVSYITYHKAILKKQL